MKVNPKAISMQCLYGFMNPVTNEWVDGIFAKNVKEIEENITRMIVCDGPVDSFWVENLNTVLDDSKMLCLSNGQRIKLPSNFCMLFEVENLDQASPATVSRCGMIYMNRDILSSGIIIKTWVKQFIT